MKYGGEVFVAKKKDYTFLKIIGGIVAAIAALFAVKEAVSKKPVKKVKTKSK